jgi:integrase
MKSEPGSPMTLGGAAAAQLRFIVWCKDCQHQVEPDPGEMALGAGVNIKAVSSRLGHASAALTLSTYAHLLPGADQDAAQRIDDLLSGSKRVANQS